MKVGSSGVNIKLSEDMHSVRKYVSILDHNKFKHLRDQYTYMKYLSTVGFTPEVLNDGYIDKETYYYDIKFETGQAKFDIDTMCTRIIQFENLNFPVPNIPFESYLKRLGDHLKFLKTQDIFKKMTSYEYFNVNSQCIPNIQFGDLFKVAVRYKTVKPTLCHGDFTLENVVNNKLIDTNFLFDGWNHWLLDSSKLAQSFHYAYEDTFSEKSLDQLQIYNNEYVINNVDVHHIPEVLNSPDVCHFISYIKHDFDTLFFEATHYIRMLKYKLMQSDKSFQLAYIRLCQVWNDLNTLKHPLGGL